jgi:hypothetical protein
MENQSMTNFSETTPISSERIKQPPVHVQSKTNLIVPILLTILVSATVFGVGGYYYGKQSPVVNFEDKQPTVDVSPQPTQIEQVAPAPSIITVVDPSSTPKPSKKLTYSLPANWKTLIDTNGRLDVGYDSARYEASAGANRVDLSGKSVGTGSEFRRLGWNKNFYLTPYNGGSRHTDLYKILGVTSTSDWKSPEYYSEREYSYNGWSCLVINGVVISQFPVAWGYCPISSNEALVLAFDGYDWSEIEQQIMAVRLLK